MSGFSLPTLHNRYVSGQRSVRKDEFVESNPSQPLSRCFNKATFAKTLEGADEEKRNYCNSKVAHAK